MFKRLQRHWGVTYKELILILCTFAITGTATAWLSKKISTWMLLDKYGLAWWMSKIIVIIFGYQLIILIVGYCLGMFPFFWKYEKKILIRFGLMKRQTKHIAIFASGAGSNAQKIIEYFRDSTWVKIDLIVCNKPGAGVLKIATDENIPVLMIEKKTFNDSGYVEELKHRIIDFIILAGFLWKLPSILINTYPGKIINIHPALLPSYGGKGMYGNAVHTAVINAGEKQSGITIHYVDDKYDNGEIILQKRCNVDEDETPESLAQKIHLLEHSYYPKQIETLLKKM